MTQSSENQRIHATCVALDGQSVLLIGDSGSGKSSLALRLIALGAMLVSDDSVDVTLDSETLTTSAPKTIEGKIEARGFGILEMPHCATASLKFVVDMNKSEVRRLPDDKSMNILGQNVPLIFGANNPALADAVFCVLKFGSSGQQKV